NADMADHRTELLRQTGLVKHAAALAFQVGGEAQHGANRGHASTADTRQQNVVRLGQAWQLRVWQLSKGLHLSRQARLAQCATMNGDKAWAETFDAAEVLVTGVLIDFPLAALSSFLGQHGQTTGFDPAIAAAFTHCWIDQRALFQILHGAAFAPATLLG